MSFRDAEIYHIAILVSICNIDDMLISSFEFEQELSFSFSSFVESDIVSLFMHHIGVPYLRFRYFLYAEVCVLSTAGNDVYCADEDEYFAVQTFHIVFGS